MVDRLAFFLKEISIFAALSSDERRYTAELLTPRHLGRGETLFVEGDAGDAMYIVRSGAVGVIIATEAGSEMTVATLQPGDFLGEMSVFEHEPRSATCRALEDTEVLQLHETDFNGLMHTHPQTAIAIMQAILEKIAVRLDNTGALLSEMVEWGETAQRRAFIDELTGLYNRRYLDETLTDIVNLHPVDSPLCVIMMDLDNFTAINGEYGTEAGDRLIADASTVIRETFRETDILVRYGGDEFTIVLPRTTVTEAVLLCANLRTTLSSMVCTIAGDATITSVTASQGIALWPDHGTTAEELLVASDGALYRAKAMGRSRAETADYVRSESS